MQIIIKIPIFVHKCICHSQNPHRHEKKSPDSHSDNISGGGFRKNHSGGWPEAMALDNRCLDAGKISGRAARRPVGCRVFVFTDFRGRKVMERRTIGGTPATADTYSSNGRIEKTTFGNPRTRTVSYTHTTRGDIASITAPSFSQTLAYSADSCRNGNIRTSSWKGKDGIQRSYTFSYDAMNRLTRALYSESGRTTHPLGLVKIEGTPGYTESVAYGLSSNPVRIRRHGITEVPATAASGTLRFGLCDDITLTYSGDRLVRADDTAPDIRFSGATDFSDGASKSSEYTYDAAGNMLTDANRGIDAVTYNRLHRPETVQVGSDTFGFTYDAAGNLLQRTHYRPIASGGAALLSLDIDPGTPSVRTETDTLSYCGPFEYSNGALSRVNFPGGYVKD
ncbi:MAG: hypothetical protein K2K05_04250, partial [Muribaculaceae bacterium]|nr:hypothetical protein [Muribaculaceae bacterium]